MQQNWAIVSDQYTQSHQASSSFLISTSTYSPRLPQMPGPLGTHPNLVAIFDTALLFDPHAYNGSAPKRIISTHHRGDLFFRPRHSLTPCLKPELQHTQRINDSPQHLSIESHP
jgi:hypothetical protein